MYKKRLTACLGITAVGEKLKPLLIFKGKGTRFRNLNNHDGYLLYKNAHAWMTKEIFKDYLNFVVKRHLDRIRIELEQPDQLALIPYILDFSYLVFSNYPRKIL